MFGERYFATRDRLADVMRRIAALARETGTGLADVLPLDEMETGLGTPFLFVLCGEVNAGKSSLINGLCGHDLCPVNILPETNRVLHYRHGTPSRDFEVTPMLEERYRPLPFLRDFNFVDTPGTNSSVQGHQEIIERFLPTADLVLFVFPFTNPWGASAWNFLSSLSKETLERVVLIVQQSDQRDSNDIDVILGHMADLSMKRIGHAPPIFAVSGKLACEAKLATPVDAGRLKASGYPELESFISRNVCQSPARKNVLETWRAQASTALHKVEDDIEKQSRGINGQNRFIELVELEIDGIRQKFVTRLPSHLAGVAAVFETEAVWVTRLLRRRLGAFRSIIRLFTGDSTAYQMESVFIERLQSAVVAVAEKDGGEVVDTCHSHWTALGPRVKSEMGMDLTADEPIGEILATAKTRFVERLGRAAGQGAGSLKVRNQLDKELRHRNVALKSFVFMALLFTTAGASCGALALPWLPWIFCGLAVFFLAGAVWVSWVTHKSITRDFQQRLLDTCGAFANTLYSDYEEALRMVFRDYASTLGHLRTRHAREKLAIEPRLRSWQELFLTLKAIEQDL